MLFGTDAPWQSPAEVLAAFLNLPLTDKEQRQICYDTARQLLIEN
ncbi:MAG: amidohydrolase family protein [Kiritimatiellae bacterium]|nr:amidohydrolase family protein [Kiritimatiellia bacterium]